MRKNSLNILLVLVGIVSGTHCSAQTTYQTVPDSLTCITPAQDVFFLGQAFTIKGLQTTIVLKTKENDNLNAALLAKGGEVEQAHVQEKLAIENNKNSQADLKVANDKISKIENKGKVQTALLWFLGPLAIVETGFIAVSQYVKRLSQ